MRVLHLFTFYSFFLVQYLSAQSSLNFGVNTAFIPERFITGPNIGYTFSFGEKWSVTPNGYFHLGRINEVGRLRYNPNYSNNYNSVEMDIQIKTQVFGGSFSLKRYLGKNSENENGGFYIIGFLGMGQGKQNLSVGDFDTSMYRPLSSRTLQGNFLPNTENEFLHRRVFRAGYGFGYDQEIADLLFLYLDGGLDIYDIPGFDINLYLHIGIRKRFFKI